LKTGLPTQVASKAVANKTALSYHELVKVTQGGFLFIVLVDIAE
jgi:hypothetical protein